MILEEIAERTKVRISQAKQNVARSSLKERAYQIAWEEKAKNGGRFLYPFEQALRQEGMSFICEVKRASPSKGVIAKVFPYTDIAMEYEKAGAAALSVLTEPYYFKGSDQYLREIAEKVTIPILRKDFTVDSYMIYQAKCIGASAVLFICAILSEAQLMDYLQIAEALGLSALVEAHTAEEVETAIKCGARIIGVNNRDLKTFRVDIHTSERLRGLVPGAVAFVSESGIKTADHVRRLKENGTDAVLIGEALMKSDNKKKMLEELRG